MNPQQNMCPYCGVFQWSQERNYLLQKHHESKHPEVVVLTDALFLNPDLESFLHYSHGDLRVLDIFSSMPPHLQ
jgi:hypothetical protein